MDEDVEEAVKKSSEEVGGKDAEQKTKAEGGQVSPGPRLSCEWAWLKGKQ